MLSCRVVLEHSMIGHSYCGPTSMPTRNTSQSQWRSQKFFSGRRRGTHMTGMGSDRKGAGKATHYICLLFVTLILPQQWQYDFRCPFPPFQSKKLSNKLSSGVGKPAICNNVMTKQAMTWKSWEGAQGFSSMGRHHSPIVSLAFHLRVLIKRNPFYDILNTCNRYCSQSSYAFESETCYIWRNKSCTTAPWQFSREMIQWSGTCIGSNWSIFHGLDECYDVQVQ